MKDKIQFKTSIEGLKLKLKEEKTTKKNNEMKVFQS